MADKKTPGLFSKILTAGETALDHYIAKARSDIASEDDNAYYGKAVSRDLTYSTGANGYHEKSAQLSYAFLSQMSKKDSIVAAVIQTVQNKVAAHAVVARDKHSKGFRIKLKNEEAEIQKLMEELFGEESNAADSKNSETKSGQNQNIATNDSADNGKAEPKLIQKADGSFEFADQESQDTDLPDESGENDQVEAGLNDIQSEIDSQDAQPGQPKEPALTDKDKRRIAKEELRKRTREKIEALQELVLTSGSLEDRPFESRKWNFDAYLRAIVRDRLTYDQIATEIVPDNSGKIHHWKPIDGGTVRYSSAALSKYKDLDVNNAGYDFLYPEKELEAMQENDSLELDPEKLENDDYKYVQVVRGRIVRAFTPDELAIGMANPTTDIYANGYSVSELEILVGMVSAHIFTENYNRAYFTQGFSAKGILHIKAPLNRRKLETVRVQWQHMIKGNRNSFQTPIMSGMDDVKWIPLTQSHSDMEFNNWMNYLIKIICAVYQIDPFEIGFGMKEEGGSGGGLGGDNSKEKTESSKTKGFVPMLRFLQSYLNSNIISRMDPDYELEFVGIDEESKLATLNRQKEEVKFKKTVNEIRAEDDLPPIEGADDLVLDPVFFQWYTAFHKDGQALQQNAEAGAGADGVQEQIGQDSQSNEDQMGNQIDQDSMAAQGSQDAEEQQGNEDVNAGLEGVQGQIDNDNSMQDEVKQAKAMPKKPLKKAFKKPISDKPIVIEYYRTRK